MALTKCKDCGTEMSTRADACPKCGRKRLKAKSIAIFIVYGLMGLFVFYLAFNLVSLSSAR